MNWPMLIIILFNNVICFLIILKLSQLFYLQDLANKQADKNFRDILRCLFEINHKFFYGEKTND